MDNTTITISRKLARRLNLWKHSLGCSKIEEVLDRILKIIPASQLQSLKGGKFK